jgi:hypothetical protein
VCLAEDVADAIEDEDGDETNQYDSKQSQAYKRPAPVSRDASIQGQADYSETDSVREL